MHVIQKTLTDVRIVAIQFGDANFIVDKQRLLKRVNDTYFEPRGLKVYFPI